MATKKIYIIDGSGYIFRAYYGVVQPLSTKDGLPTNALFGFSRMLLRFLRELKDEHGEPPFQIAMVFDAARRNYRHDIYPEYKANRAECPEDLVPQMPYFREIAHALGFPVYEKEGFEADDIIASLVRRAEELKEKVVIVSADKDLTQLVNDSVIMWDPMRDITFDKDQVVKQFGVSPSLIPDYLSLVGDSSDNIPGGKGIGPKTAVCLLEYFKSLDALLSSLSQVSGISGLRGARGVQEKLESSLDNILLSRKLVRLEDSVPVDIEKAIWTGYRQDELSALMGKLEFNSLLDELKMALPEGLAEGSGDLSSDSHNKPKKDYSIISIDQLREKLAGDPPEKYFAIDTETDSLDTMKAELLGVSVSWVPERAFYVDVSKPGGRESDPLKCEMLGKTLLPYLSSGTLIKCGSNLKYDIRVLGRYAMNLEPPLFDTMVASYVLRPDGREHGLKALSLKYLGEEMKSYKELTEGRDGLFGVPVQELAEYAAHDADASLRLSVFLEGCLREASKLISDPGLYRVFEEIEMPLVPILARMEDNGIRVDLEMLGDLESEFASDLSNLTREIYKEAGEEFNINSPKQLGVVLFEHLGIPTSGLKKTQTGFSTDAGVLARLQGMHPVIDLLLEYREVHKLQSTYIQALQRLINKDTGRIHASFNQAVAATGRLSSSDPNLQNIPIRTERGKRIRTLFTAEPGKVLVTADYSQIELRVLAHLSGDENLCQAFRDREDIHTKTARELFGETSFSDLSTYRRIAKTINFGIIYGMGAFRLAGDLGVSRGEAQEFINTYFDRYPKVKTYFDYLKEQAELRGYVETLFGRRRYVADLDMEGRDKGYAARSMMNAPIQGTAAEIVKVAMISLDRAFSGRRDEIRMVLQVHDELVFEVPLEKADFIAEEIRSGMEEAVQLKVPLVSDVSISSCWGK
ncbi:MAG TPA: DNA polymerase I [Oligoflexia bacterium]|nr:DNA polymerase I [Oligoflexia bacterium]HMP48170.1 DNA polymerase I [Oligoflexia bacterium]